jgi:hypothetical protein
VPFTPWSLGFLVSVISVEIFSEGLLFLVKNLYNATHKKSIASKSHPEMKRIVADMNNTIESVIKFLAKE